MNASQAPGVTRRAAIKGLVAAGVGVATGAATYSYAYERVRLGVVRAGLPVSGLPDAFVGLRVGLITDLHHSQTVPSELVTRAVDLMLAEEPDLIVLGGDYVTWSDRSFMKPVAELLTPLHARHGVFAVLGNHDDERNMPAALAAKGFEVLKDARTRLTIKGDAIELAGVGFWTRDPGEVAQVVGSAGVPTILLAHDPRRIVEAAALGVPAVISGHTHGGQILVPGLGAVVGRKFPILAGSLRRENSTLFVSRGVGTVYVPFRLNCPPEIAILTLEKQGRI